jgi:ribosomal protein L29
VHPNRRIVLEEVEMYSSWEVRVRDAYIQELETEVHTLKMQLAASRGEVATKQARIQLLQRESNGKA